VQGAAGGTQGVPLGVVRARAAAVQGSLHLRLPVRKELSTTQQATLHPHSTPCPTPRGLYFVNHAARYIFPQLKIGYSEQVGRLASCGPRSGGRAADANVSSWPGAAITA
jgi:hypothetical protein